LRLFVDSNRSEIKLLYPGLRVVLLQSVLLTSLFPAEGGLDSLPTPSTIVITGEEEVKMELFNSSLKTFREKQEQAFQSNTSTWTESFGSIILSSIMTEWNQVHSLKDDRIQELEYKTNFDRFCFISRGLKTNLDLPSQKFVDVLRPLLYTGKISETENLTMCRLIRK